MKFQQSLIIFATISVVVLTIDRFLIGPLASNGSTTTIEKVESSSELLSSSNSNCLDLHFNQSADSIINIMRQVFIIAPAKSAGTTIEQFSHKCMGKGISSNIIQRPQNQKLLLTTSSNTSIIASHLFEDRGLIKLSKYSNEKTLIVYVHREESSRITSAIKQVLHTLCQFKYPNKSKNTTMHQFNLTIRKNLCAIDEDAMLLEIATRPHEIGMGTFDILTCEVYQSLVEDGTDIMFIHYKQINKLMKLLEKRFCSKLLNNAPIRANVDAEKGLNIFIKTKNEDGQFKSIALEEWLSEKQYLLEWALDLRSSATCQSTTKSLEKELLNCPDQALKVTPFLIKQY